MDIRIGCVVRVETQREAVSLLKNCPEVAGVIWKDQIEDLPVLTLEQHIILSQSHVTWHHEQGLSFTYGNHETLPHPPNAEMQKLKPYFDMATKDVLAANEFKNDIDRRKHWFLTGLGNDTKYHCDLKAKNIWLHRHLAGGGLRVFFPTENKQPLQIRVGPHPHRVIRADSLKAAFEAGSLSSLSLEQHDVIAFNENMLHISNTDSKRFRSTVNGFGR